MKRALLSLLFTAAAFAQVRNEDIVKGPGADWLTYAGTYSGWRYSPLNQITAANAPPAKQPPRPIPVVTATVKQRDLNLYLIGLGTVTAFKTVTVRSRVEGELQKVTFEEGQMVREGDLLAEIDPRPYEVQRDQAEGQLAKEEATLKSAKQVLARLKTQ